jgi:hypothetical protein
MTSILRCVTSIAMPLMIFEHIIFLQHYFPTVSAICITQLQRPHIYLLYRRSIVKNVDHGIRWEKTKVVSPDCGLVHNS